MSTAMPVACADVNRVRVLVTRPAHEAGPWLAALSAAGLDAQGWPLMAFGPPADTTSLAHARRHAEAYDAIMFVSPQAVQAFCDENFNKKCASPLDLNEKRATKNVVNRIDDGAARAWAPGPGTARALVRAGWLPERIDQPLPDAPQFDSEALWSVVASQVRPGFRLLIVRGEADEAASGEPARTTGSGRDWLAHQCEAKGAVVSHCVAYRRVCPQWDDVRLAQARMAAEDGSIWLISSSQGLMHLAQLLPGQDWQGACAVVTHPRIGAAAQAMGFGAVIFTRPSVTDVVAAVVNRVAAPKMVRNQP